MVDKIVDFLHRVFCRHKWEHRGTIYGQGNYYTGYTREHSKMYKCTKCGKCKDKKV